MLLDAGFTEEQVMVASEYIGGSWTGPTSRHYEEKLRLFQPLLVNPDPRIQRIGESAVVQLRQLREEALKEERGAAVKGTFV